MKFTSKSVTASKEILANDHYVALPFDLSFMEELVEGDVIKAGTIIPENTAEAIGVCLYDVNLKENPNGAVVVHGFINAKNLDVKPTAEAQSALRQIVFIEDF